MTWKTKPTDRFLLRFIKIHLSAPLSETVVKRFPTILPLPFTITSAALGILGGVAFAIGMGWLGGLLAALAQIMDGMDGQIARLTGRETKRGAFLDSVLDRYMDIGLLFGILLHCLRFSDGVRAGPFHLTTPWLILAAGLAVAGSSQVSYATARAQSLGIAYRRPESAGKASRTAAVVICGLLTPLWIHFPLVALLYLALHPNIAVLVSLMR